MATTHTPTTSKRPYKTPCDEPMPVCPVCGGLECLCRPRFFAGQLLTDEDLRRLDHYIVAKNRLHNRYLHGSGVVCGLEVVCHPCNMVAVRPGYAIGPCGEDIVVCDEQVVDVCSLINACRKPKRDECEPFDAPGKDNCADTIEQWVLSVVYEEKPSRGVTALKGASGCACCSKCACGGSGSCGCKPRGKGSCGCKEHASSAGEGGGGCGCGCGGGSRKGATHGHKHTAAQCEPTIVCEGFHFEVCKLPPRSVRDVATPDRGALIERIMCCLELYQKHLPTPPANPTLVNLKTWCCDMRDHLVELFAAHPGHSCLVAERLGALCGNPAPGMTPAQYQLQIVNEVKVLLGEFLRACFCSALLPPCPSPVDDDRVYLATITIRRKDCRILEICNWDQRRFVISWPALRYWLSPLPYGKQIKAAIANVCCREVREIPARRIDMNAAIRMHAAKYPLTADEQSANFSRIVVESAFRRDRTVDAATIAMASLGAVEENGEPLLTEAEMRQPAEALLIHQLLLPLVEGIGATTAAAAAGVSPAATVVDMSAMRSELAGLRTAMDQQQRTIEELTRRLDSR
jgi:hypothetical protein